MASKVERLQTTITLTKQQSDWLDRQKNQTGLSYTGIIGELIDRAMVGLAGSKTRPRLDKSWKTEDRHF